MYNKTSGYSTKDTMKALADVCGAVPLLLKVAARHIPHF
jgi:hypothetical protein